MGIYRKVSSLLTLVCVLYIGFLSLLQFSLQNGRRYERTLNQLPMLKGEVDKHPDPSLTETESEGLSQELGLQALPMSYPSVSELPYHVLMGITTDAKDDSKVEDAQIPRVEDTITHPSIMLRKLSAQRRQQTLPTSFEDLDGNIDQNSKVQHLALEDLQQVTQSKVNFIQVMDEVYVYGAYLDSRYPQGDYVRLLLLQTDVSQTTRLLCHFLDALNRTIQVTASTYEMCENHGKKYGGWIYSCLIPDSVIRKPEDISVSVVSPYGRMLGTASSVPLQNVTPSNRHSQQTSQLSADASTSPHQNHHLNNVTDHKSSQESAKNTSFTSSYPSGPNTKIHHNKTRMNFGRQGLQLGVCVPPLYGDVYLSKLISFIEMCRVLGATKIFLYIHDISEDILMFLKHYRGGDPSILSLVEWNPPIFQNLGYPSFSSSDSFSSSPFSPSTSLLIDQIIWNRGQLLAVQHCLYTNMVDYEWLLFMDTDEMLVPQTTSTWPDLISDVTSRFQTDFPNTPFAGISFASAFFQQDFQTQVTNSIDYFQYLHRTRETSAYRSKLFVQPSKVFELGIHHLSRPVVDTLTAVKARPDQGLLHHYRKCVSNEGGDELQCEILVKDETVLRYEVPVTIASRDVVKASMEFFASRR